MDYYHRKFPTKNIEKLYLLCDHDYRADLEAFMAEIGLNVSFADITRHVDKTLAYSLSFIKGYSASLSASEKTGVSINLLAAREKLRGPKERELQAEALSLLKGLRLDYRVLSLSVLICIATFIYGIYRILPLRKELTTVISARTQVASIKSTASSAELANIITTYKTRLTDFDTLIKNQLYLTMPLNIIPRLLPGGSWLTRLTFNKREKDKSELVLEGMVYLGDSNSEFEAVNKFLSNLKESTDFNKYFTDITISSVSSGQFDRMTVTNFTISCKNYKGAS